MIEPTWSQRMVEIALEDAMRTLASLPPGGYSTRMSQPQQEIVREEVVEYRAAPAEVRLPIPNARKIDEMDRTLLWLRYIPAERYVLRRIVGLRAITHHVSGKPLSWRKIANKLHADHVACKRWHGTGIEIICRRLNAAGIQPVEI